VEAEMSRRSWGVLLLCALLAPAAWAQSTLADETCVVVTQQGFFVVTPGQPTVKLFDTTPFGGGTLEQPSVSWINGTDAFIVTRRDVTGSGGLWRVELLPGGGGSVQDLAAAMPPALGRHFIDSDYSVGLDTLFVLERQSGRVLVDLHPATSTGASCAEWAAVPADACVALAVRGAKHPFSVLVTQVTGEILSVDQNGVDGLNVANNPSWSQVATEPLGGGYFLASQSLHKVVVGSPDLPSGLPQFYIDLNVFDFGGAPCNKLAPYPLDIAYDARTGHVVALAGGEPPACAFGGVATGANHVLRLPLAAVGPPGTEPVLLTPPGASGITGAHGDLALVRHDTPDITWYGVSGSGAGASAPVLGGDALVAGTTADIGLDGAPTSAAAVLVLGLTALDAQFQGQLFGPFPRCLLPATTDAAGQAEVSLAVPPQAALSGLRVYMQWWIDDTTTPAAGDRVSSQVGIFTIGL
jgi:hypothetical protein